MKGFRYLIESVEEGKVSLTDIAKIEITPMVVSLMLARMGKRITPENLNILRTELSISLNDDLISTDVFQDLTAIEDKDTSGSLEDIITFSLAANDNNEKVQVMEEHMREFNRLMSELKVTYRADIDDVMSKSKELLTKVEQFTQSESSKI